MPEITVHLEQIFNDSLSISYYPAYFRESVFIILCPKNYRLISLLNTIGKIMEAIMVARISYMASTHEFFFTNHFGIRRESCMETAIHHPLEKIFDEIIYPS